MNTKLIEKYLAKKIAMNRNVGGNTTVDPDVVGMDFYRYMQMNEKATSFDKEFLSLHEKKLQQRFGINAHPHLFVNPTLGQWITDVTATWTADDIFNIVAERTLSEIDLYDAVSSDIEMLDIIDLLEAATGKNLCGMKAFENPMTYLNDITYKDLAAYFAA